MAYELNVTYLTVDGYVELHKYRYLYFVIIFTAYILVICSNVTIICLIWIHRNLHEPMYVFIAALLMNSLLYSSAIYPKLLVDFLSEKPMISYPACLFQWFMFYTLCASEILLLSAMAYDRYVSICKPLQYPTIMTKNTVTTLLVLAWFVPACQTAVPICLNAKKKLCNFTFKGIICNSTVYKLHCVTSTVMNIYGLVVLTNLVLFPVFFILFTYLRIFIMSYQSCREVRRKAAQTCLPHLMVLINFSCLGAYDVLLLRLETDLPQTVRFIITLNIIMYHPIFNPIIYGLNMKEIYKHLKTLFHKISIKM